ncbi:MAG: dihydrolipoamide acetyltransferase family protein [Thermoanaerobacteraceae bacterium]|nr:dihydrolipoamide acetyltransferase family protein [Thermoanaerobacteraceae bacterium]
MATNILMPKLGLTMVEGTVTKWYKKEGDPVKKGETLVDISTEKISNQLEAPDGGILKRIMVKEGETAPVSSVIGIIAAPDEKLEESEEKTEKISETAEELNIVNEEAKEIKRVDTGYISASPAAKKLAKEKGVDLSLVTSSGVRGMVVEGDVEKYLAKKVKATPVAEKMAKELNVDLSQIQAEGRISKEDVQRYVSQKIQGDLEDRIPLTGMRKVISDRMSLSWHASPHVTEEVSIDISGCNKLREAYKQSGVDLTYTDIIVKAVSVALKEFPYVNASVDGEFIVLKRYINIGVAVALDDGLIVPNIKDADKKGLKEISEELKDLSEKARNNSLATDDVTGGTFTVTNLGMYGIESFTPIINPPESAILGVNKIEDRLFLEDGNVVSRSMIKLSLSFDHRLIDGAYAARFLNRLKGLLENPMLMLG